MKGLFIPEITAEMFRNGCLESIEALMAEGEIYDIDYQPPCEDAISREDAIRIASINSMPVNECVRLIKELSSVTPSYNSVKSELEQTRWIPCSERLPDTTDEVLVTDGVDMMVAWHDYTLVGWASFDSNFDTDVPIKAWMPLPQPYKAESEDEKWEYHR